jgi:hypothetical protein
MENLMILPVFDLFLEAFSTLKLPPLEGVRGKICEICEFRGYRRASFGYI